MPKKRIGAHVNTAGGVWTAVQRAVDAAANTMQIFSSSPKIWKAGTVRQADADKLLAMREEHDVSPLVIHASFLLNLSSYSESIRASSIASLRAEVLQALALGAEFLVLHPGSWKELTRDEGLRLTEEGVERAFEGLELADGKFQLLLESMPGAEFSLGGNFEQLAELHSKLKPCAPVGICLDSCHLHVSGYDLVTADGYAETMRQVDTTFGADAVRVWHCNDAKAPMGSRLDRHEHIGDGTIGPEAFRRILHDERFAGCAFIAETPHSEPGDPLRDVIKLRTLSAG